MNEPSVGTSELSPASVADKLQDLVIESADVAGFLGDLCGFSARSLSGTMALPVVCAVTLSRRKHTETAAWSDDEAREMDEIQRHYGSGPCLDAMHQGVTILVEDTRIDPRWAAYNREIARRGQLSVLAVPLELEQGARAALNFFAREAHAFDPVSIENAELFAAQAGKALRLAVRVATSQQLASDLQSAMESRTPIDLAAGIIMAQNRCSQEEAMAILVKASSGRNMKLRTIAEQLVQSLSANGPRTHFDA
ncbi:GAF and ANTAR domain-containing protein [Pseudarthrobacter sp. J75]|uniref:GAF and ANTAR domain-containing protein n=1 Tax=unclassified Pseudarthrobacter TaxID=2647000 RepID=UPI002E820F23|nr:MULTISPECIES: GAF and ANTAR domain-containing protein [unclassified Pseudarthrobacter]MEE2523599.1 GAF and ANTAR domain-containing protein [Pseudarthrobacter sp. J47]MEE2530581.1 GAF and ANTAR domain-containing protein [Pseudarthrobacter sp. J75]